MQTPPLVISHVVCGLIPLNFLASTTMELFFVGIFFTFFIQLWICTWLLYFPKVLLWQYVWRLDMILLLYFAIWTFWGSFSSVYRQLYCYSRSYYAYLLGYFWMVQTKKSFKRNKSARRKYCYLKALKKLLMYAFVTLLKMTISGPDNRHFL